MVFFKIVEKNSFWYCFFRKWLSLIFRYSYCGNFYVRGRKNVPKAGTPIMFVSNHQNGVIDALSILFAMPIRYKVVFLARADVFKKKLTAKILNFCKIMPIYRQRDGRDNLGENAAIFDESAKLIDRGYPVALFPEGQHQEGHYLGPVKKGFARIAFEAAEHNGFPDNMWIVPIGNHYEDYFMLRPQVCLSFGEPIRLSDYYEAYRENPPRAMADLAEEVQRRIGGLMLDIPDREHYALYDSLRAVVRKPICAKLKLKNYYFPDDLEADRYFAKRLRETPEEELAAVREKAEECRQGMACLKIGAREVSGRVSPLVLLLEFVALVLTFPVMLYGLCFTGLPVWLGRRQAKKMVARIKNPMLQSSFDFVLNQLIYTGAFYLVYIVLYWCFFDSALVFILLMATWVLSRMFWIDYFHYAAHVARRCRALFHFRAVSRLRPAYEYLAAWAAR